MFPLCSKRIKFISRRKVLSILRGNVSTLITAIELDIKLYLRIILLRTFLIKTSVDENTTRINKDIEYPHIELPFNVDHVIREKKI